MFSLQAQSRKRGRDEDEDVVALGFGEHRTVGRLLRCLLQAYTDSKQKRHIASLPHRQSPKLARHSSPLFNYSTNYTSQPLPPTITPADSDCEDVTATEPRSFFSPYSSPLTTATLTQSGSPSPFLDSVAQMNSQSSQLSDAPSYSDDFEMTDSIHLSPGPFHSDPSPSITGRIPTPIHSSFAPFVRADKVMAQHDNDFADDEAMVDRFRRARRLPSPISEGEMSPSIIIEGVHGMQMDVESLPQETPTKKGHQRSKHSLRQWSGFGYGTSNSAGGNKKSLTMGYRADCEKCRLQVPGHFVHINST